MDALLDLGIDLNYRVVEVGVVVHENLRVPSCRNENRIDAGADRSGEDVADLKTDAVRRLASVYKRKGQKNSQERKGNDDSRVRAICVVPWVGEKQV